MGTRIERIDNKIVVHTEYSNLDKSRSIPSGVWNKVTYTWDYPLQSIGDVIAAFPDAYVDKSAQAVAEFFVNRDKRVDALVKGEVEPRKHKFLMKHQRLCRDIAMYMPKYAFYCDVGTGKTLTAFSIIADRIAEKWLVICPKSIIQTGWMYDKSVFYPEIKVLPIYSEMKNAQYKDIAKDWGALDALRGYAAEIYPYKLAEYADVVITNPEMFKNRRKEFSDWQHNGVIVDESSILRNKDTQITKELTKHMATKKYGYLLSGKPAPNSQLEYFPQMAIVNPAIFGTKFYPFRDKYFEAVDFWNRDWVMKSHRKDAFTERLAKGCIFIHKEDCLDLPPVMPPVIRKVSLTGKAATYYKQMEKEQVLLLQQQEGAVLAKTKLASYMKLRQITSGFIIDTDAEETYTLHEQKLNELKDVITELGDNKAVIWINFKAEVAAITEMLDGMGKTYSTAYSETKNLEESVMDFKSNKTQFMIAHPKTLKYGQTFTGSSMAKNCTYAIYYSMSYSYEDYYQSYARIYRKGQTESCTYIYLIASGTIDGDIYNAIVNKGDEALIIENLVDRVKGRK